MPTINQLTKRPRKEIKKKVDPVLGNAPHRKGTCTKVYVTGPKKPNSANRTCVKISLTSGRSTRTKKRKTEVIAYVPFQDGRKDAKVHGVLYIERKNKVDLPGIRYVVKRGWGDLPGVNNARQGRSLKGAKRPEKN